MKDFFSDYFHHIHKKAKPFEKTAFSFFMTTFCRYNTKLFLYLYTKKRYNKKNAAGRSAQNIKGGRYRMANRPIKRKKTSASNREQQRIKKKKAEKTVSPLVFGLRIAAILAVYLIAYIFLSHSTFKVENIAVEGNSVIFPASASAMISFRQTSTPPKIRFPFM